MTLGPFWITTTVIFLVFVVNSIGASISAYMAGVVYEYDFTRLTTAATIFYAYLGVVPLIVWLFFR